MKKLLYLFTMLFNAFGILFAIWMLFTTKNISLNLEPLIFWGISVFTISFIITFFDFRQKLYFSKRR